MPTVLITGCDSGLGREFARQYAQDGWDVWATCFDLASDPVGPGVRHAQLDVTDPADFVALRNQIGDAPIDVLVSNAGVGLDAGRLGVMDFDHVQRMLQVNLMGPLRLVETFADNVAASRLRRILFVSSRMGSIASNLSGGHYGYRASKAGLNAVGRSLAIDLYPRGITVAMVHPGWVSTAGGSPDAPLDAVHSVAAMRKLVASLGNHETGVFLNQDGQPLPW